jgi:hypothetical protein
MRGVILAADLSREDLESRPASHPFRPMLRRRVR